MNYTSLLADLTDLEFLGRFSKNPQISNFVKIRLVGAQMLQAGRQADTTKLKVAFRNSANVLLSLTNPIQTGLRLNSGPTRSKADN